MHDDSELEELEQELRRAAAVFDPVPPGLQQYATAAYGMRTIDAELAELTFDSTLDREALLVRGGEEARLLTFRSGAVTIDLEVSGAGSARRLVGRLAPGQPATIQVRSLDRVVEATADDLGRFAADLDRTGPFSLRCRLPGEPRPVVTDWMT